MLSPPVSNDILAVSHDRVNSNLEMRGAVGQQVLVTPFSDPRVSAVVRQWRKEKRARPASDQPQPVYPDWLLPPAYPTAAAPDDPRECASIFEEETYDQQPSYSSDDASKTPSLRSTGTAPSERKGHSGETARRNLLAWLSVTGHFCCHATSTAPVARMLVQVAHILLPRSTQRDEQLLLWYKFLLGMAPSTLRVHSRLFMVPRTFSDLMVVRVNPDAFLSQIRHSCPPRFQPRPFLAGS
jgi:hypothetical protein